MQYFGQWFDHGTNASRLFFKSDGFHYSFHHWNKKVSAMELRTLMMKHPNTKFYISISYT